MADTVRFEGNYGNIFYFGSLAPGGSAVNPIMKPEDVWNVDTKMDDGKPATGSLVTWEYDGTACSDLAASGAGSLAASAYLLSATGTPCRLIFKNVAG